MFSNLLIAFTQAVRNAVSDPFMRFWLSIATLFLLTVGGTVMYMIVEDWDVADSLYMTIITIATVGFGEVRQLSSEGRILTMFLIVAGVGAATTAISNAVGLALGPLLWTNIQQRRNKTMIDTIRDHYIVCGYGRMGRQIIEDFRAREVPFLLVDANADLESRLLERKIPYIIGDATRDEVLIDARIEKAKGLVAALNSDASNVMTVLTAREMNPDLFIVSRVVLTESESKLKRAGANRVINPYQIGGHRMALTLLRPVVHDFLDHIFHFGDGADTDIGQIAIRKNSPFTGKTIATIDLRQQFNVNVLGVRRADGELIIPPSSDTQIQQDDILIVIGPPKAIYELEQQYHEENSS